MDCAALHVAESSVTDASTERLKMFDLCLVPTCRAESCLARASYRKLAAEKVEAVAKEGDTDISSTRS